MASRERYSSLTVALAGDIRISRIIAGTILNALESFHSRAEAGGR